MRARATAALAALLVAGAALLLAAPHAAAGTSLSTSGCSSPTALAFPTMQAGSTAVTSGDCTIAFGSSDATARLRVRQADGVGTALTRLANGSADTGFASAGVRTYDPTAAFDAVVRVLAAADGSTLAVGIQNVGTAFVARYDVTGSPVPSFGTGGVATFDLPGGAPDTVTDAALLPDGRIVVVGAGGTDASVAMLTAGGQLDGSFSGDGMLAIDAGASDEATGVVVRPDGRIVVAASTGASWGAFLVQLLADGRRDTSFGVGGIAATSLGSQATATDVALLGDGTLVLAGQATATSKPFTHRFDVRGIQLAGSGQLTIGASTTATDVVALPDRRALVATSDPAGVVHVTRLRADGSIDTTYGTAGTALVDPTAAGEDVTGLALDAAGNALVALNPGPGGQLDSGIARLLPDGALDARFGTAGYRAWAQHATDHDAFSDVTATPSGAIVAGGMRQVGATSDWQGTIARLTGGAISDYGAGGTWATGSMFGACLRTVGGLGASATWTANASCAASDGAHWNDVPADASGAEVASTTTAGVVDATASLRFGTRVDTAASGGSYVAPITVEVLAPDLEAPANTVLPTISGTATARKLLSASTGTWTGSATITHTYRWRRCDSAGANCVDVAGATAATYLVDPADAGSTLRVAVTATNSEGSATATSAQTAVVGAGSIASLAYMTGFEHQTANATGGGLLTSFDNAGTGSVTPETSIVHSGDAAMRFTTTSGFRQWNYTLGATSTARTGVGRAYVNVQQLPAARQILTEFESSAGEYCEIGIRPDGRFEAEFWSDGLASGSNQVGATATVDSWHLIDYSCDLTAATWRLEWRIDGVDQPPLTFAATAAAYVDAFQIGIDTTTTIDVVFDDVAASRTLADYPLGPARVRAHKPNGIGSVVSPADWEWSTFNGAAPTALTAGDANQSPGLATLLDEWPVNTSASADLVEQNVNFATLDVNFTDTDGTVAPSAVNVVGAQRERVTGPQNSNVTARSTGSQSLWTRDWSGGATVFNYLAVPLAQAPGGGAWTTATFDALHLRLSGSDAVPETYTDALLLEAQYPVGEITRNTSLPMILGAPKVGATLQATTGSWTPNPTGYAYQWKRCNASGTSCTNIAGATSATYVPVALDAAGTLRVRVTATTAAGNQSATSLQSSLVAPGAPTLTYLTGFEHGTTDITGVGLFNTVTNATASRTITRNGRFALRTSSNGSTESYVQRAASGTVGVMRFAIMFEELPASTGELAEINTGSGYSCDLDYAGGRFRTELNTANQTSTMLVEPGRWYVIDMRCSVGGATRTIEWMVDGAPQATTSEAIAASSITGASLGTTGTTLLNGTARYDDWALSATSADYPIGAGKVVGAAPDGTGPHDTPTSFGSANSTWSWTPFGAGDANQRPGSAAYVDDWPMNANTGTDHEVVRQTSTTGHLVYTLQDPEETGAVNGVRLLGAHHSSTPANNQDVELRPRLAATAGAAAYSTEVGTGGVSYYAGLVARPGGGTWTAADLDSLELELDSPDVGAAGDHPWTHALLVEADLPVGAMATNTTAPGVSVPWDVPKVGDELRAEDGTWTGVPILGHRYAWLRCNSSGVACTAIDGANGPSYTLQPADAGSRIRVIDFAISRAGAQGARSAATELVSTQPTFWYLTGFEHGASSAQGGGIVSQIDPVTNVDTAVARNGSYSMRSASTGAGAEWEQDTPSSTPTLVGRMAIYLDSLPAGATTILELTAGGSRAQRLRLAASGQISADFYDGSSQSLTPGPTLQTGRWYLVDLRLNGTTTAWTLDWRIDGAPQPTVAWTAPAPAAVVQIDAGVGSSQTMTMHVDDIAFSSTATDFPIGNGRTLALAVDGTGSGGTTANFGPAPQTAWAAALAEVPMTATTSFVEQTAITSSLTDHVPFTVADPASTADARAVRGIVSYGATAAGTNHVAARVRRPGDTLAAAPSVFSGNAEVAALSYGAAIVPAPTGGWTRTSLANTDWIVGFSTDVAPAPRVHGLLLEVEYRGG